MSKRLRLHVYYDPTVVEGAEWAVCGWINEDDWFEEYVDCWESAWITACSLAGYEWRSIHGKNYD